MPGQLNEAVLDERLTALEAARSWSPRVVSWLESRIRGGEDLDLFRINPIAYAAVQAIGDVEAIDLFLHATRVGLFDWSGTSCAPAAETPSPASGAWRRSIRTSTATCARCRTTRRSTTSSRSRSRSIGPSGLSPSTIPAR